MASEPVADSNVIDLRIERLFIRFTAIYGYMWWNTHKNEEVLAITKREWSTALKRFDNHVVKDALLFFREKKIYPPSLPEFVECCVAIQKRLKPCLHEVFEWKRGSKEVAVKHLSNMFEILKKN